LYSQVAKFALRLSGRRRLGRRLMAALPAAPLRAGESGLGHR
jgi:hypothetical protein